MLQQSHNYSARLITIRMLFDKFDSHNSSYQTPCYRLEILSRMNVRYMYIYQTHDPCSCSFLTFNYQDSLSSLKRLVWVNYYIVIIIILIYNNSMLSIYLCTKSTQSLGN